MWIYNLSSRDLRSKFQVTRKFVQRPLYNLSDYLQFFYNKILSDFRERDTSKYANTEDLQQMLKTQSFPAQNTNMLIGGKVVHYRRQSKNIMLTIFEGGHDMLSKQALEYIEQVNGIR